MGKLRAISLDYVFYTATAAVAIMFIITLLFYKEPPREIEGVTLKKKFQDMKEVLTDKKYLTFISLLGVFFWLPFWAFFNVLAIYINDYMNTAVLYEIEAAEKVGYSSEASFNRAFKKQFRLNPSAMRIALCS